MKKIIFSIAIISLTSISCDKEDRNKLVSSIAREVSMEQVQINLSNSGGEINNTEALKSSDNSDYYTQGELEYIQNQQRVAVVNFGDGEENSVAELKINGEETEIELLKEDSDFEGKDSKYKKVIVEPIVKSEDCDYIIAGIIKYYDTKTKAWVATIDFGDLTCDEWAEKTTADSSTPHTFSLKELNWK